MILYYVFFIVYYSQLDYDEGVSLILRFVDCQLKVFFEIGMVGDKLYLYFILNFFIDFLFVVIVGILDELQFLEDYRYILNIY